MEVKGIIYKIIRSSRKTVAIQIMPDGQVLVRCPVRLKEDAVAAFVKEKAAWIQKQLARLCLEDVGKLTPDEINQLRRQARELVAQRVQYYAAQMGVSYGRISIRAQHTLWGSCSSKRNLNFNCLLALVPMEVLDYIVVHELCHLKEMNHSEKFWQEVERILPDYQIQKKWLKENGTKLMAKL